MRFVDLFAGLGGFNIALTNLGHECVFASEIDATLCALYKENFGIQPMGDIRSIPASDIPQHDILCAGFPCQPFSKARDPNGSSSAHLGDLYLQILRVVRHHHPEYLILENVPNLKRHEYGQTWSELERLLQDEDYFLSSEKLSPHQFGVPQIRQRIYIVASRQPLDGRFAWPAPERARSSIRSVLDKDPIGARYISRRVHECFDLWQELLDRVPPEAQIPQPLWSMEFGATYPYQSTTPAHTSTANLRRYRGSHGSRLSDAGDRSDIMSRLPSHARETQPQFPDWKVKFIRKSREFYATHRIWLDDWIPKMRRFPSSFQKLEWNVQERDHREEVRDIYQYVLQVRPSGVRVKRPTTAPSLVAMTSSQVPIVGWERRYMTTTECQRLQSMEQIQLPGVEARAYAALGNAINVKVAQCVAESLIGPRVRSRRTTNLLDNAS